IKEYKRDKNLNRSNNSTGPEETAQPNKANVDIDSIVNGLAALSINWVEQEKLNRSEVEDMVKNLVTKTVMNLNKRHNQPHNNKPRICYLYCQEGHIVKDCSKHDKENDQINKGITFNNADICLVEFTETKFDESGEYLK
ncbi:29689_t:CDS:1, partial [Racocetra persica]